MQDATKAAILAGLEWCETCSSATSHIPILRAKASLLLMSGARKGHRSLDRSSDRSDPAVRKKLEELQRQQK